MRLVISKPAIKLSPAGGPWPAKSVIVSAPSSQSSVSSPPDPESAFSLVLPVMMLPELFPVPVTVLGNRLRLSSPE